MGTTDTTMRADFCHPGPVSLQQRGTARFPSPMPPTPHSGGLRRSPVATMLSPAMRSASARPHSPHPVGVGRFPVTAVRQHTPSQSWGALPVCNKESPNELAARRVCRASLPAMKASSVASTTASTPSSSCMSSSRENVFEMHTQPLRSFSYSSPCASQCASPPRVKRVFFQEDPGGEEDTRTPDAHGVTEPLTQKIQLLEAQLHKASHQLQHQQKMVKQLMQHVATEQERRISLENALVDSCSCSCCEQGQRQLKFDV